MVSIDKLKVEFGVTSLFSDVSYVINRRDRIALVGKNGVGKSTMLKILAGLQKPTSGTVSVPKDVHIGYLPQVMKLTDSRTVREETELAFANMHEIESNPYRQIAEMSKTLKGLGFTNDDLDRPTSEFSGGWRMRIELAKILLQHPDVLLLDEPTNHLDIDSIQWLEGFLARNGKAVVLVSHDRAFLNNVTTRTIEISCGHIYDYKVSYDEFVKLRQEQREQQLRAYENQQKQIQDTEEFIERFRYKATKAMQVQSRIKQLEKIVPIEVDEVDNSRLNLKFSSSVRSGNYPVICDDVSKSYGEHLIFSHVNLTIHRGEKVAFVGRNGEGKSTFVKCIMNEIAYGGKLTIGHNVEIGYFAQNQAQLLDDDLTVFETVDNAAQGDMRLKVRDILGAFMFGGEASDKKVRVLSGGERSRLAMIKLLLEPVNFLILDEPTNHLDMPSKDVLKQAIMDFDGTVVLVSHDRDFLDGLVTKVYEFTNGRVREHLGGIYDYLHRINSEDSAEVQDTSAKVVSDKSGGNLDYTVQKEQQKMRRKLEKQLADYEEKIAKLETEQLELESQLAKGTTDAALFSRYADVKAETEKVMEEWGRLAEQIDQTA